MREVKEIEEEEGVVPVAAPVTVVRKPVPRTKQNERQPSPTFPDRRGGADRARGSRDRSSAASRRARARARRRAFPVAHHRRSPRVSVDAPLGPRPTPLDPTPIGGVPSSRPRDVRASLRRPIGAADENPATRSKTPRVSARPRSTPRVSLTKLTFFSPLSIFFFRWGTFTASRGLGGMMEIGGKAPETTTCSSATTSTAGTTPWRRCARCWR